MSQSGFESAGRDPVGRDDSDISGGKHAARALEASEKRYRRLFESARDGILNLDATSGEIVDVNPYLLELTGYSRDYFMGKHLWEIGTFHDIAASAEAFSELQAKDFIRYEDLPLKMRDGTEIAVEFISNVYLVDDVRVIQCNIRDISQRRRAEDLVRESEMEFRSLAETMPQIVWMTRPDGANIFFNQQWMDYTGLTLAESAGNGWLIPFHPDDQPLARKAWRSATRDGQNYSIECRLRRVDGTYRWWLIRGVPRYDSNGEILKWFGTCTDIHDIKQTELTRRDGEEEHLRRMATVVRDSNDAITIQDFEGRITAWNRGAELMYGYGEEEALRTNINRLTAPNKVAEQEDFIRRLVAGEAVTSFETQRVTRDGRVLDVWMTVTKLMDEAGKPIGLASTERDITARERTVKEVREINAELEERVRERTAEAERANHAKSAFLANMSHEIRTPMNAIMGFAQLLHRDRSLSESHRKQIDIILRNSENLLKLISEVLDYSKIEAGRLVVDVSTFDLHSLLADLEATFCMLAEAKGLTLRVKHDERTPRFVVADESRLGQILRNLMANAVKFTERGGVVLRATVERAVDAVGPQWLQIEVEDTGPGIAPEEMGRLFQVFEQTDSGRLSKSGTGLGLAISRKFAGLLGGTLQVVSELGVGSTFTLRIPVKKGDVADAPGQLPERRVVGLEPGQPTIRVLVADDIEDNRSFLKTLLVAVGFEVRTVEDGALAVQEFTAWKPHLILMDLRMPAIGGIEATRHIRELPGGNAVSIIVVTASAFKGDQEQAIDAGADSYLSKPFREEALFEKIEELLRVRYRYSSGRNTAKTAASAQPVVDLHAAIAALPEALIASLCQAALTADFEALLDLAVQAETLNPAFGQEVRRLAQGFAYGTLLTLLKSSRNIS